MEDISHQLQQINEKIIKILEILEKTQTSSENMDRHIKKVESFFPTNILYSLTRPKALSNAWYFEGSNGDDRFASEHRIW